MFLLSEGVNDFRFVQLPWTLDALNVNDNSRRTRLNYELHLNYNRTFAEKHATTALLLFKREKSSRSNYVPATREDWVGRLTYNYDSRYYIDVNGAYNGSSKFGDNYRFDFFPSAAVGWRISEEAFMADLSWLDGLKFKASYGMVGHDGSLWQNRWLDQTQYRSGGYAYMDSENFGNLQEVYQFYMESVVGNPLIHWETSIKTNYGFELVVLDNHLTVDYDYFTENRKDILVSGTDRSVHDIFGADPPTANTGETEVKGHEIVMGARHRFNNGLSVNGNFSFTRAKDKVIKKEDPELRADYQKDAGFPIGTNRTPIPGDLLTSLDDLYTSIPLESGQSLRRTGYYEYLDYNGDGVYSGTYDNVPYGYTNRPENTWTA
ncbi:MAG TPA: hypothetical protein VJ951_13505, partial [Bacteroidales bacterium]|nr:hypothetical protein [Bacteroidales bacterium]